MNIGAARLTVSEQAARERLGSSAALEAKILPSSLHRMLMSLSTRLKFCSEERPGSRWEPEPQKTRPRPCEGRAKASAAPGIISQEGAARFPLSCSQMVKHWNKKVWKKLTGCFWTLVPERQFKPVEEQSASGWGWSVKQSNTQNGTNSVWSYLLLKI